MRVGRQITAGTERQQQVSQNPQVVGRCFNSNNCWLRRPCAYQNIVGIADEIDRVGGVFAVVGAIEPRQSLRRSTVGAPLIDLHAADQRPIEAGLEFVGHEQDLVLVCIKGFARVALADEELGKWEGSFAAQGGDAGGLVRQWPPSARQ